MQTAAALLEIIHERGKKGLPLERLYRHLFNPELYLRAYGKIYRNDGAMTSGASPETVDGMSLKKIQAIIEALRHERYRWTPVRRIYIDKKDLSKKRPLGWPTWSDKLLQEVIRSLLEAYYEPQFSGRSHRFRPGRGCHTALREVQRQWCGTVWFSDTERFVICHNPEAAQRDAHMREQLVVQLTELIDGIDTLSEFKRGELRGKIAGKPGLNRYLRTTPAGKLRIDHKKIKFEENLDGKYLLRCSDPHLPAEDIALGCKQLLEVERGWRDMKQIIDLRPVYHRLEERIRAHVILCWLALLLIRIIETTAGTTWQQARPELNRLHLGTFTGPTGTFRQVTDLTNSQIDLLSKLRIDHPKKIIDLQTAPR
ncbi:IS1634 family transposase [Nonomuraea fuscirosea]|uniref:IS1634 family transposase n=1 Tax=Nonomuraea fuscirosea TaxID=1291556 RepID=UPI00340AFD84